MTTAKCPKSLSALLTFCKSPYRAAMLPIAKVIFTQFFSECSNSEPRTFKSWGNRANHQTGGNRLGPDMANVNGNLSLWQNFHQINVYCLLGSFCFSSISSHKQHHRPYCAAIRAMFDHILLFLFFLLKYRLKCLNSRDLNPANPSVVLQRFEPATL